MGYRTYTCPIARDCGGCEWLAVPYTIQLRRKQEQVDDLLGAMIGADKGELRQIVGMKGEPVSYRHKAATPYAHAGRGRIACGFSTGLRSSSNHPRFPFRCRDALL